ncbi:SapC family protein [Paraglaciecola aquimarina]|uniref:SapC family protein n=1 Tax=Paraglaciecola algarum TaxID=3050085 RepID=A0ABS9DD40_9ALTE|nr:SapC family protein [Paraglaciecola sp. G1-23]MCF2950267.1 SapC family protein [Paraglaciecola sp. G1-23]
MTDSNKSTIELLDSQAHRKLKIQTQKLNTKQNRVNVANVSVGELNTLVHEYPVFITKSPNSGDLQLTAILGFKSGENLFLKGDEWRATYLPLDIIRRPFQAYLPDQNNPNQGHIAIDLLAEQVNEKHGTPLFDDQGNKTEFLQRVEQTFSQIMGGAVQTLNLLKQAEQLGLIESINLSIEVPNKGKVELNGLLAFNKEAVDKLSGQELEQAHQSGLLQVIHLLLSSTLHLQKLIGWSANQ